MRLLARHSNRVMWFHSNISFSCFARRHSIPFERLTPAPFSQLIYCLVDIPALSGSPPVAPTCGSVQRDAPSIIPHMGGESLRQSRLNYIIVRAPPDSTHLSSSKMLQKTPPTHTHISSPVVCSSKDACAGLRYGGGGTARCLDESIRLWRQSGRCGGSAQPEAVKRGSRATFHSLQRPSVTREAEELKENQLVFQCKSSIWVFKGQINIIPLH